MTTYASLSTPTTVEELFAEIVDGLTTSPTFTSPPTVNEDPPPSPDGCNSCQNDAHGACQWKYEMNGKSHCCCGGQSWDL